MGWYTGIIITAPIMDYREADKLTDWLYAYTNSVWMNPNRVATRHGGTGNALQAELRVGSVKYLDIPKFLEDLQKYPWEDPEAVLVLVNDEHDNGFAVYEYPFEKPTIDKTGHR